MIIVNQINQNKVQFNQTFCNKQNDVSAQKGYAKVFLFWILAILALKHPILAFPND